MDRASLITIVINAVATIVTTYVVTRISLGKPVFIFSDSFKNAAQRYWLPLASMAIVIMQIYVIGSFLANDKPISKLDVVRMPVHVLALLTYGIVALVEVSRTKSKKT